MNLCGFMKLKTAMNMESMSFRALVIGFLLVAPCASEAGYDKGGRCPICGKFTMCGGSHLCKQGKSKANGFSVYKSGNGFQKQETVIPNVLKPAEGYGTAVISEEPRSWKDAKGRTIDASWDYISENGNEVVIKRAKSNKRMTIKVLSLSAEDQKFVNEYVKGAVAQGKKWLRGVYVDEAEYESFFARERAKTTILEKAEVVDKICSLRVFQVLGERALCDPYFRDASGKVRHVDAEPVLYMAGKKSFLVDGDKIEKQFFWCGTFNYETRLRIDKTIHCLTDDPEFAIRNVAASFVSKPSIETSLESEEKRPSISGVRLSCTGSGFFVTKNGYIVTNHHVVEGGVKFSVLTSTGERPAKLVFSDADTDLALLKVEGVVEKPFVFSRKRTENLGATVMTIGFPQPGLQGFDPKVTKGVISGERGFRGDVREYQIDASIQPGNSGGPLFNDKGCLVGVVVASLRGGQVVNYAIKKSYLQAFLDNSVECSAGIVEDDGSRTSSDTETVVSNVRSSCVLVMNYK